MNTRSASSIPGVAPRLICVNPAVYAGVMHSEMYVGVVDTVTADTWNPAM